MRKSEVENERLLSLVGDHGKTVAELAAANLKLKVPFDPLFSFFFDFLLIFIFIF
jgi:hypothetical protein